MSGILQLVPVGLVAALAPLLPFRWTLACFLAVLPFADAYAAGGALAIILCCWTLRDLPRMVFPARALQIVAILFAFAVVAIVQSAFVADDPARLISELAQWLLTIALAGAVILSVRQQDSGVAVGGMIVGGLALAVARLAIEASGISFDGGSSLLHPEASNYASLYVLFGAVVLPLAYSQGRGTLWAAGSALIGLWAIHSNESRAALVAGLLVAILWVHAVVQRRWMFWTATFVIGVLALTLVSRIALQAAQFLQDPTSVASVANFQTNFSNLERLGLIVHSFEIFAEHPLGMGIGASSEVYLSSPYTIGSYPTAHNTLAMLVAELGIVGLLAYVAALVVMFVVYRSRRREKVGPRLDLIALAVVLSTVFDAVLFNGVVAITFWVLMALVLSLAFGRPSLPKYVLQAVEN